MKLGRWRFRGAVLGILSLLFLAGCNEDPAPTGTTPPKDDPPIEEPPIDTTTYVPGETYFSEDDRVEYHAGNLPVIITAPHGGDIYLDGVPARTPARCGVSSVVTVADANTANVARSMKFRFYEYTGKYPHVIINRVHRSHVEANRNKAEGACGNEAAEVVWQAFNDFIDRAEDAVLASEWERGWYVDLHGHGHTIQRHELGYLLTAAELRQTDEVLDLGTVFPGKSSIRTFAIEDSPFTFSDLLRGNKAIGTELARRGYPSVPSKQDPAPKVGEDYFNGGYNTQTRACRAGGDICGLQIEMYRAGVRDTEANRKAFSEAFVQATDIFLGHNLGISLFSPYGEIVIDNDNANNDTTRAIFSASSSWGRMTDNNRKYLDDFLRAEGAGPAGDDAHFDFMVPARGRYAVYARWPDTASRSNSVRYQVYETVGGALLYDDDQNQQQNGGEWVRLGEWDWPRAGWARVLVSRSLSGPGQITADAVRVIRVR